MKFHLKADTTFEADDIMDALEKLSSHFHLVQDISPDVVDPLVMETGEISIAILNSEEDV